MALSTSESALLTETCENMNIAANTCREVLEMLRSLGNTGVVDIATHNNAATAHANATNLVKKESDGTILAGTPGAVAPVLWPLNTQIEIIPRLSEIMMTGETKGAAGRSGSIVSYRAVTDSSGDLIDLSTAGSAVGYNSLATFYVVTNEYGLKNGEQVAFRNSFGLYSGTYGHLNDFTYSAFAMSLSNGSTSVNAYSFNTDGFWGLSTASVGLPAAPWDAAYFRTAPTITSDRREKSGISAIGSEAVDFIKALRPVHFTVKLGKQNVLEADEKGNPTNVETIPGTRRHWGLIAQEVQEALVSAGYDPSACAVWSLADKNDPDSKQALRYEELIAPMIKVIQNQQERIEALERKVA